MALPIQPYKGTRDFYPEDMRLQKWLFAKLRQVVESFGFQEYDAPLLELEEIYLAKSGEEIVNQQLYSFEDKGGRRLAIRPEMTPSVSRMVAARRQELAYPLRLYSIPNLWRYERPQRGRLREHWQLNVDIFGVEDLSGDHEIILVADSIMKSFGAPAGSYSIRISGRQLVDDLLDDLKLNAKEKQTVLKIMDRYGKVPADEWVQLFGDSLVKAKAQELLARLKAFMACRKIDELPESAKKYPSTQELGKLFKMLTAAGVDSAIFDLSVVRGMDYYTDIVFEVYDEHPDNNRSMFGGGRYDGLVELFGVKPLPTVGFGMGDVTLLNFLEGHGLLPQLGAETDAVFILVGDVYTDIQSALAELRKREVRVAVDSTDRKLDSKIKSAVKAGLKYAIFAGEKELSTNSFKLKDLRSSQEKQVSLAEIAEEIRADKV